MVRKTFFIILLMTLSLEGAEKSTSSSENPDYYPHLTTAPRTVGSGKFTFQPTAGFNLFPGSFLLNNLSYGINKKFEIGFIPLMLSNNKLDAKILPMTFKMSIFEGDSFDFGYSYTFLYIEFLFGLPNELKKTSISYNIPQLNSTYRFSRNNQLGLSASYHFTRVSTSDESGKTIPFGTDIFMDFIHSPGNHLHYGVGVSSTQDLFSPKRRGMGFSVTEERKGKFLSSPRLGMQYYSDGTQELLVSTSFY